MPISTPAEDSTRLHSNFPCHSSAAIICRSENDGDDGKKLTFSYSAIRNCRTLAILNSNKLISVVTSCRAATHLLVFLLILLNCQCISGAKQFGYTNEWAVNIKGGEEVAKSVALRHGYLYKGEVRGNCNIHYQFLYQLNCQFVFPIRFYLTTTYLLTIASPKDH